MGGAAERPLKTGGKRAVETHDIASVLFRMENGVDKEEMMTLHEIDQLGEGYHLQLYMCATTTPKCV